MEIRLRRSGWGQEVFLDALMGAAAGVVGTWMMSPAQKAATKLQSDRSRQLEKEGSPGVTATALTARRLAKPFGIELDDERAERAGLWVHYFHGAQMGALFGALAHRWRAPTILRGLIFGFGLWLFVDEGAVPALGLAPPPQKFPLSTHLKALAAHLAFGTGTDVGYRALHRAATGSMH
jgi:hypothetical protein